MCPRSQISEWWDWPMCYQSPLEKQNQQDMYLETERERGRFILRDQRPQMLDVGKPEFCRADQQLEMQAGFLCCNLETKLLQNIQPSTDGRRPACSVENQLY